jgi:hypothetical protein
MHDVHGRVYVERRVRLRLRLRDAVHRMHGHLRARVSDGRGLRRHDRCPGSRDTRLREDGAGGVDEGAVRQLRVRPRRASR